MVDRQSHYISVRVLSCLRLLYTLCPQRCPEWNVGSFSCWNRWDCWSPVERDIAPLPGSKRLRTGRHRPTKHPRTYKCMCTHTHTHTHGQLASRYAIDSSAKRCEHTPLGRNHTMFSWDLYVIWSGTQNRNSLWNIDPIKWISYLELLFVFSLFCVHVKANNMYNKHTHSLHMIPHNDICPLLIQHALCYQ
jgi:hypothetical protein